MKAEITGIKIKLGEEEKTITLVQAVELRDALNELLGKRPDGIEGALHRLADTINRNSRPVLIPQPYPVYPRPEPWPSRPWREVWRRAASTGDPIPQLGNTTC